MDFLKLLELYLNRKDKFKKVEERAERRKAYFKEISEIDGNTEIPINQKKAFKNSAAQKLTGSMLVNFALVDYYSKHPDFNNFDVIAPLVAFWDDALIKTYDQNLDLVKLEIDPVAYKKESRNLKATICLLIFASLYFFIASNSMINYFSTNFYISQSIVGIVYILLTLVIVGLIFFIVTLHLTLVDLKRLVK
ncbi:hypothetical protein WH243_14695 [Acinetobacter sp. MYb177]|uniref:hypothetical protein n=1 Tax=unclassified Acinetobacter TaxID=196816 RepID=UPI0030AE2998